MGRWQDTHEGLRRAALELFLERGYESTATAQIASRAGVTEMTLFRHFPTKESLLLSDPFDPLMADAVRARPAAEPAMRALVEGVRAAWEATESRDVESLREVLKVIAVTPTLQGAIERNSRTTIVALTDALQTRGVSLVHAKVAAAAVIAGLSAALSEWARSEAVALSSAMECALSVLGGE